MDSSSAASVLQETRQHATLIGGQVADFHAKLQQIEQTAESKFGELQHAQQELLQHIQAERDRARAENDALVQHIRDATEWLHQTGTTLQSDAKSLTDDLNVTEHGAQAGSTALHQAVDHLAQLTTAANEHVTAFSQQTTADVDHAHDQVHETLLSTLGATQEQLRSAASQHEAAVTAAFHNDFHGHQTDFHAQAEAVATQAAHTMHDRGDRLHGDVSHEVDNLHQHQDQHHQDLMHQLEQVKQELNHLGSLITDTAHGLADGVDTSSLLLQQTNLGVTEILKIIQNIESVFQDIIGSM